MTRGIYISQKTARTEGMRYSTSGYPDLLFNARNQTVDRLSGESTCSADACRPPAARSMAACSAAAGAIYGAAAAVAAAPAMKSGSGGRTWQLKTAGKKHQSDGLSLF